MTALGGASTAVAWEPVEGALAEPIVRCVPYVELKLELPGLDATRIEDALFPDAMPYRSEDERRVFYWRGALPAAGPEPPTWRGVCSTTHGVRGVGSECTGTLALWTVGDGGHEVVVDGTVAGGSKTAAVRAFEAPEAVLQALTADAVRLDVDGETVSVPRGTRRTLALPARECKLDDADATTASVTPELSVRYPGERTLYHPARGAEYVLFPSFGIDLDGLDAHVSVPTVHGELDHDALADVLGVDIDDRPYPERVLWQAFAYTAFDPHRDGPVRLAQTDDGLLQVANPASTE